MKTDKQQYPASYGLAIKKGSYVSGGNFVQRCAIKLGPNKRIVNTELCWKPISRMI